MKDGITERRLRKDNALPEAFRFYAWKCFPENSQTTIFIELRGGICEVKFKSGPRKGIINYAKGVLVGDACGYHARMLTGSAAVWLYSARPAHTITGGIKSLSCIFQSLVLLLAR